MTVDSGILVDPRQQAFWDSDPSILKPPVAEEPAPKDSPNLVLIGVGIAAAIVGIKMVMSHAMSKESPKTPDEARSLAGTLWLLNKSVWQKLATPAIVSAYKYGTVGLEVAPDVMEKLAILYADELGEYLNSTSVDAMLEGFSAQLNSGMNSDTSWIRSTAGYGLDSKQTRSYIVTLTDHSKGKYEPMAIPEASLKAIDRMMVTRADRMGINEAYKATQMGKNMIWAYLDSEGELKNATKSWITAEDELVCSVCASLDRQERKLWEQFETPTGEKLYTPGAHPNCRCELVLNNSIDITKRQGDDPFNRDKDGRFNKIEARTPEYRMPIGQRRMPIGMRQQPIGSVRAPIGQRRLPIGESRAPIAQARPLIGHYARINEQSPIAPVLIDPETLRLIPIDNKPKTKTAVRPKTKVKAPVKAAVKTPVEAKVDSPIEAHVDTPISASVPIEPKIGFHAVPVIMPATDFINHSGENFASYVRGSEGKVVIFSGSYPGYAGEVGVGTDHNNANIMAFAEEIDAMNPSTMVNTKFTQPALPELFPGYDAFIDRKDVFASSEGGSGSPDKRPIAMFVIDRGWNGELYESPNEGDPPQVYPVGRYRITNVEYMNASTRTNAFPESVRDMIEDGVHPSGFANFTRNTPMVEGITRIHLTPISRSEKIDPSEILKRAPRLVLRRK